MLSLLLFLTNCSFKKKEKVIIPEEATPPKIEYQEVHGFSEGEFAIDSGVVKSNQSFGQILESLGVNYTDINILSDKYRGVYDIRKIYPNDKFYSLKRKDSLDLAKFIYQHSPTEIIVMSFEDSVNMEVIQKPIMIKLKEAGGKINSSMWQSFIDLDLTPALVANVSNLYAWTIDFFGVQPDDSFKVIYEAKYVDNNFIGVGDIKAMVFNHSGKDYYAFQYSSAIDQVSHYYNENGESMKRALLSAPLEYVRISSKFSHSRLHPIKKIYRPHYGVDYAAPTGTNVVSTGDGKVIFAARSGGAGKMIKIKHTFGNVVTKYLHLSKFQKNIKVGAFVEQGEKIAEVGNTGLSTGPHLDYRVYINGKPVNPLSMDIPSKDPIPDSLNETYLKDISVLRNSLDNISFK